MYIFLPPVPYVYFCTSCTICIFWYLLYHMYISLNPLCSKIKKNILVCINKLLCECTKRYAVIQRTLSLLRIRVWSESNCLASNRRGVTRNEKFVIYWLYYKSLFLAVNCPQVVLGPMRQFLPFHTNVLYINIFSTLLIQTYCTYSVHCSYKHTVRIQHIAQHLL